MGLKNISLKAETIKYNGVERIVKPGDVVDVRDFDINNSEVNGVEHLLSEKHKDAEGKKIFELSKTLSNMTDEQINDEIASLRTTLEDNQKESEIKDKELVDLNNENADLKSKLADANEKINALQEKLDAKKSK